MTNKIKENIKNNKYIYLTLLIGIIIISVIFAIKKISPFGENSTLTVDFYHQYGPMLGELYDRIHSGSNLLYSFTMSSGLPFFRNFLNYLASPLNILILFFKHEDLLTSYSIIIALKAVISGTTFAYFIKNKFQTNKAYPLFLGLLYAFQAYFIAYYWNIMWLDGLIFLPLITLGIEKLINKDKYLLYTISLSLMIIINYFIGYMICIYSVLYFITYLIIKTKKETWKIALKKTLKFLLFSLLAGGITAFLTLPLFSSITSTSATNDTTIPLSRYYDFTITEFLINHLSGVKSTVFSTDITNAPNIACGIITIPLLILFILNKNIPKKTKICYLSIYTFLIISFFFAPLDFIWHAFHTPNDLPYRFSFIYSFILLLISSYSLSKIEHSKLIHIIISIIITLALIIFAKFTNIDQITNKTLIINTLLLGIYFILYLIIKYYKKYSRIIIVIFTLTIGLECILNVTSNWEIDQLISDFNENYSPIKSALYFIKDNDDDKFYRIEQTNTQTLNDSSWYGYNGITSFSSMNYENMAKFQRDLGIPGNEINSFYYRPNTPIYNLMFNLKYTIGDPNDYYHFDNILTTTYYELYENKYTLNLLYGVNSNIKNWKLLEEDPIQNQENFIEQTTNIKNVFNKQNLINQTIIDKNDSITLVKYTFENNYNNNYFYTNAGNIEFFVINDTLYYQNNLYETINFEFPELIYDNQENYSEKKLINFITNNKEIEIYIGFSNYYNDIIDLYSLNDTNFLKAYNALKDNEATITEFKESKIEASINLNEDMTIYTSIPYDKGWKVLVDGKEVETFKIGDTLLGFDTTKGNHTITLKYFPYNMNIGIIISIISITSLIIITKKRKLSKQNN